MKRNSVPEDDALSSVRGVSQHYHSRPEAGRRDADERRGGPAADATAGEDARARACRAPVPRLKDEFRYQILLKAASRTSLNQTLQALRRHALEQKWGPTALVIDVDPVSLL